MERQRFVLILERMPTSEQATALAQHKGLCVVRGHRSCIARVLVDRDADHLFDAVASAVNDIESVGLRAVRVEDHDWVTLGHVAERVGRTRETLRLWSIGSVGPGNFPPPLNPGSDTRFYSWTEVAAWLGGHIDPALRAANLALQLRALAATSSGMGRASGLISAYISGDVATPVET